MKIKFIFILLAMLFSSEVVLAKADVQFSEQGLVFAGKKRSGKLTLSNKGDEAATVTLGFLQEVYAEREQSDKNALTSYTMVDVDNIDLDYFPYNLKIKDAIRITPKRVRLAPGEKQVVRLTLRKPVDLLDGVYRANIAINYIETYNEELANLKPVTEDKLAVGMGFQTSIHIPLMVINGEVSNKLEEFKVMKIERLGADIISKSHNTDLIISYKISGNSIGQYTVFVYVDDNEKFIYARDEEVSNFVNYHVKRHAMLIDDNAQKIRVEIKRRGTEETLFDITHKIEELY